VTRLASSPYRAPGQQLVRRTTGRTLGQFFAEEIAGPLDAEFHIGMAPEHDRRVSLLIQDSPDDPLGTNSSYGRCSTRGLPRRQRGAFRGAVPNWAEMNGHGNARGIAAAQSVLANGGAYGKKLLSDAGREQVLRNEVDGVDVVLGIPLRWGWATPSPHRRR
jgi:CubicO group peptidase (beta-lactamase class C family)